MNNRELHYFIGGCLAIDNHPEFKERINILIRDKQINWERFVLVCSNNLILQTIYVKFRDHDILELLPPELSVYLEEIYTLNSERNKAIFKQIEEIIRILNAQNIQPVFIKGSGNLIDGLYKDPGERILADIDLLVPDISFLPAAKCLENLGYKYHQPVYETYSQLMHYPSLSKDDVPAEVEIHRSPVMLRWSDRFNNEMVLGDKKDIIDMEYCSVPSDQNKIIINFIHSQLSNKGSITGLVAFRDMYDIYLLAGRTDINTLMKQIPFKRRAISYFNLISRLFGLSEKIHLSESFSSRFYLFHYHMNLSSRLYYHTFRVIRSFGELLFVDYLGKIPLLIIDAQLRKSIYRKLSSKEWYKTHLRSYRHRFH